MLSRDKFELLQRVEFEPLLDLNGYKISPSTQFAFWGGAVETYNYNYAWYLHVYVLEIKLILVQLNYIVVTNYKEYNQIKFP